MKLKENLRIFVVVDIFFGNRTTEEFEIINQQIKVFFNESKINLFMHGNANDKQ